MLFTGRRQQTNLPSKLNVNEEYMRAFRTESYTDMLAKVHGDQSSNQELQVDSPAAIHLSHLHEHLLEPQQETLMTMANGSNFHELLLDYFNGSLEAFKTCSLLLDGINQTRKNYMIVQKAFKLGRVVAEDEHLLVLRELARFAALDNPFAGVQFGHVHELNRAILGRLNTMHRKVKRRVKLVHFCKWATGVTFLFLIGALTVTALVVVGHTVVGIVCIPPLLSTSLGILRRRRPARPEKGLRRGPLSRLAAQLDAAAKGAYILDRDFDTMSRLVARLHDEVEHKKAVVRICLRSHKGSLLKEALKEFESSEYCFLEQLEELESHVYLCFLTINRSRRLVLKEL